MKHLAILGSTGSIGQNTLQIVKQFPDQFCIEALGAGHNIKRLAEQIQEFSPQKVAVYDKKCADDLSSMISSKTDIVYGEKGYCEIVSDESIDMVVSAIVGAAGLLPTVHAIHHKKDIALANKETLVMAGEYVMATAQSQGVAILPVDSEHSAIFQCLQGHHQSEVDHILLTASGGPFFKHPSTDFHAITPQMALNHPTWSMGKKISIDSATLMNKGLEVIEARWLFDVPVEKINVLIHPQSIIHSMVAFHDGSILAQMGIPDMKSAIAYAMSYPHRLPLHQPFPKFSSMNGLTFHDPDFEKFQCLKIAYHVCKEGGTYPAVMNAANEIAVTAFLDNRLSFDHIPVIIEKTLMAHQNITSSVSLDAICEADKWAREKAMSIILKISS